MEKLVAIQRMLNEQLHHYDALCPRCKRTTPVSLQRLQTFTPGWQQGLKELKETQAAEPALEAESSSAAESSSQTPASSRTSEPAPPAPAEPTPAPAAKQTRAAARTTSAKKKASASR